MFLAIHFLPYVFCTKLYPIKDHRTVHFLSISVSDLRVPDGPELPLGRLLDLVLCLEGVPEGGQRPVKLLAADADRSGGSGSGYR